LGKLKWEQEEWRKVKVGTRGMGEWESGEIGKWEWVAITGVAMARELQWQGSCNDRGIEMAGELQ